MLRLRGISVKRKKETTSVNRTQAFCQRWQRRCEAHWSSASMQCHWYPVGLLSCDLFSISCFCRYRRPGTAYLRIWLSQTVLLFSYLLGSAVSLATQVTECLISLFHFFTSLHFFQLLYTVYMKYWACFTVCLLGPSKRQKANVRQQKDKNV